MTSFFWYWNKPPMLPQVWSASRSMAFSWRLGWWIDDDPISQLVFNKCFNVPALRFGTWPVPKSYHQSGERSSTRTQNWAYLCAKECDRCLSTFGSSNLWHHQSKTKMEQSQSLLWIREISVNLNNLRLVFSKLREALKSHRNSSSYPLRHLSIVNPILSI